MTRKLAGTYSRTSETSSPSGFKAPPQSGQQHAEGRCSTKCLSRCSGSGLRLGLAGALTSESAGRSVTSSLTAGSSLPPNSARPHSSSSRASSSCVMAVSYTHLDVYKRQVHRRAGLAGCIDMPWVRKGLVVSWYLWIPSSMRLFRPFAQNVRYSRRHGRGGERTIPALQETHVGLGNRGRSR